MSINDVNLRRKALELLTEEEIKATPRFVPSPKMGRVTGVYDGDTITIVAYTGHTLNKFSVRILGIDTPEMRTKSEHEKKLAIKARDYVKTLCLDKVVQLKNHAKEKYGRVLAEVWVDGVSVGARLIENELAYAYDGGTKRSWARERAQ